MHTDITDAELCLAARQLCDVALGATPLGPAAGVACAPRRARGTAPLAQGRARYNVSKVSARTQCTV